MTVSGPSPSPEIPPVGDRAVAREDIDVARRHLLDAGKTPGGPGLYSFGPDFTLADALPRRGEHQAVLTFLEGCSKFWKMDRGKLQSWRAQIETGGTPVLQVQPHERDRG